MTEARTTERLALSALLSHLLVAFTIECDNEFEHQMPHRTTRHGATPGAVDPPWLVSMPMWVLCLRHVPADGISARELAARAQLSAKGTETILRRMSTWWGYLTISRTPQAGNGGTTSPSGARHSAAADAVVRLTRAGTLAAQIWAPLPAEIDGRWRDRFGSAAIDHLRDSLMEVVTQVDLVLPDYLPIGGLRRRGRPSARPAGLPALLSKALLALTVDFERESALTLGIYTADGISRLPVAANVLRVIDDGGVRAADVPRLSGVATMAIDNWLGSLEEHGYLTIGPDPAGGRFRLAELTPAGRAARVSYLTWMAAVESRWEQQFGAAAVASLRRAAERLAAEPGGRDALWQGMQPYPDGWRAQVRRPVALPDYPAVSARGGFPDGS